MKVILLQDVKGLGKKDATVEVKDGYANNFLIRRGLAVKLTDGSKAVLNKQQEDRALQDAENRKKAQEVASKLDSIQVEFEANTGSDGRMLEQFLQNKLKKNLNPVLASQLIKENSSTTPLSIESVIQNLESNSIKVLLVQ